MVSIRDVRRRSVFNTLNPCFSASRNCVFQDAGSPCSKVLKHVFWGGDPCRQECVAMVQTREYSHNASRPHQKKTMKSKKKITDSKQKITDFSDEHDRARAGEYTPHA